MFSKIKLLLVEDDEDDYFVTNELLEELPYDVDVTWVERYEDGLAKLLEPNGVDIGFVDYRIGGRTGLEFVKDAKERGIGTPLVLLTGVGHREIDVAAAEAGAADFLDKSELSVGILERTIRYAIANAEALQALAKKSSLLKTTLEHLGAGIAMLDADGAVVERNAQFDAFLDVVRVSSADGADPEPQDHAELLARLVQEISEAPSLALEVAASDGRTFEVRANDAPKGGRVIFALDITTVKVQERQLRDYANALEEAKAVAEYEALYDALTGLANRRHLDEYMSRLEKSADADGQVAILHIDLDRFKQINDTLGHAAGDHVLQHVANVLRATAPEDDFKARIGGDEFVVVCQPPVRHDDVCALAEKIVSELAAPVDYNGRTCRFGASIGVAFGAANDFSTADLLINADVALYRAKDSGRSRVEQFSPDVQLQLMENQRLGDEIHNALERDELIPFFQPQFDAETLDFVGVEALARWRHPERGILGPHAFLAVAEELNFVNAIDRLMLEKSLKICEELRQGGATIPKLSVNISYPRLCDPELLASLDTLPIGATNLSFELLETISLEEESDAIKWNIDGLKERGFGIEIDDFGSGRASLVGLMKIAPDRLKIDRQLVMPMTESTNQRRLVQAIIEIGRALEIGVIAEGVETASHAELLRALGCETLQGFAFGKPMSAEDLTALLREESWRGVVAGERVEAAQ